MVVRCRPLWLLLLLLVAAPRWAAASSAEDKAFLIALRALTNGIYDRAEARFDEFARSFTNSPRLPEAFLYEAEARLKQTNYAGAIELLSARQPQAGKWGDEYLFWQAEAHFQRGAPDDYRIASDLFGSLPVQFPGSPRCLEAAIDQATACSKLGDWAQSAQVLQQTNSAFQAAIRTNLVNEWTLRGYLLLSEALRQQGQYRLAEANLAPLAKLLLDPSVAWQRQYLLCRIAQADDRPEDALRGTANLRRLAVDTAQPGLQAESAAFQGGLLEGLGGLEEAIAAYTNNLAEGIPVERQRQALLKITELSLAQKNIPQAARRLEEFLARFPAAPAADLAWLRLGEVRLLEYQTGPNFNAVVAAAGTNTAPVALPLSQAISAFASLRERFPESSYVGKAQLNLGWCHWLAGDMPRSQAAFEAAVAQLPLSRDQATACFKLADTQFQQTNYPAALGNYLGLIDRFAASPEVQTNLFERALYQAVRAGLAGGDLAAATNALQKLLAWYPDGFHTDSAVLLTGQAFSRRSDPAAARELYRRVAGSATNSPLVPELELAVARTFEEQGDWQGAINQYTEWLANCTNSALQPRAEYYRALACWHAGLETNALLGFSNLVARFPANNDYAPLAQMWIADYFFRTSDFTRADQNYQLVFLNTNWHQIDLAFQARMMAGHAAFERNSWADAERDFTNLTQAADCKPELKAQAIFAYAALWMKRDDSTDKRGNYEQAIRLLNLLGEEYATNPISLLALGEKANCFLQWSQYEDATNAFHQILTNATATIAVRSQAAIGMGIAFEKIAEQKTGEEQAALLKQARDCYLDVLEGQVLRPGEVRDDWWTEKAGLEAARILESQKQWDQALKIYDELDDAFPVLRASLESKRKLLQDRKSRAAPEPKTAAPADSSR